MPTQPRKPQDRKPPAKKTAASNGRASKVAFDLDALEREGEVRPPFTFRHGGKTFTLADPAEIELTDIIEIGTNPLGNPILLARLMGDQYQEIVEAGSIPQWKLLPMIEAWFDHYGMDTPGKSRA